MRWLKWLSSFFAGPAADTTNSTSTQSEFTAEVVRIVSILPHPNADRLEIARFELAASGPSAYDVVIQKGTAKPGDLMSYFSVDCVVPTAHPEFEFLTKRPDGAGKTHYRLKAARLRGVFSQGLLVPAPDGFAFGAPVAKHFGVTYYRAPEPEERGPTAPSSKPRPQPMPVYGVESLKKVPRLFEEGEPVCITEKVHGTNFRFGWVRRRVLGVPWGWRFVVGSHRVIKEREPWGSARSWYGEDLWTQAAERMGLAEKTRHLKGYIFFGELYGYTYSGQRIQDLTYGQKPEEGPGLAIFDILTPDGWMSPSARMYTVEADLGLDHVPVITHTNWHPTLTQLAEGESLIDHSQIREGIVVEALLGPRRKAKYVGEGYLMRDEGKHSPKPHKCLLRELRDLRERAQAEGRNVG